VDVLVLKGFAYKTASRDDEKWQKISHSRTTKWYGINAEGTAENILGLKDSY